MITKITGQLVALQEATTLTLNVGAFEYEVLIPEFTRRQLQGQTAASEISLHTIEYLEGNPMQGRMTPRLIGFLSEVEREFFELFCSVDGVGVKKALRAMVRPVKEVATAIEEQDAKASLRPAGHRAGDGRADHRQAAAQGAEVRPDGRRGKRSTRPRSSRTWLPRPSRSCGGWATARATPGSCSTRPWRRRRSTPTCRALLQAIYQQSHK